MIRSLDYSDSDSNSDFYSKKEHHVTSESNEYLLISSDAYEHMCNFCKVNDILQLLSVSNKLVETRRSFVYSKISIPISKIFNIFKDWNSDLFTKIRIDTNRRCHLVNLKHLKPTFLKFDSHVDEPVDHLPQTLTSVVFGDRFNQPVDTLPQTLKSIKFGNNFNQPVDNLPKSLESLTFGNDFDHPVNNLPENLKYLDLGWNFNKEIENLPESLEDIHFMWTRVPRQWLLN